MATRETSQPDDGRRECPSLVSLFAGAGGLDIGLERAGYGTVVATEIEPVYCETLRANRLLPSLAEHGFDGWFEQKLQQRCYKNVSERQCRELRSRLRKAFGQVPVLNQARVIAGDIRSISSADLLRAANRCRGDVDLVAGGPPCQPFSRAGKRESVDVEEGRLFREFVRIVNDLRPRWFLFENVKGLILTKTDVLFYSCEQCRSRWLAPFDARVIWPQSREASVTCAQCGSLRTEPRIVRTKGGTLEIILAEFERIGYRCDWRILNSADFGVPQTRERLFIVGSRDGGLIRWPKPSHSKSNNGRQRGLFEGQEIAAKPWRSLRESLWANGHSEFGDLDPQRAVLWVKNVVRPHDEPVTWSIEGPSPTVGAHQAAKLAIAPEGVPEEQLVRQQWHVKGRRQGDKPPVSVPHAYLSDLELLRLQSFPTYWYLHGTRMQRAFQIGNAVPPRLAEVVGKAILKAS